MAEIERITEDLKILSEPTRLKILQLLLSHNHLCVNAITHKLDVSQSTVSQHLRVLRQADFVYREKRAQHIHYSLNNKKIEELIGTFEKLWK